MTLALLLLIVVMGVVLWNRGSSANARLLTVERRLRLLEGIPPAQAPQAAAPPVPSVTQRVPAITEQQPTKAVPAVPKVAAPPREPTAMPAAPAVAREPRAPSARRMRAAELESLIGGQWLNKIGIVVLVVGVTWFLGYSLQYLGPSGKVLLGVLTGLALLAGGVFLERRPRYVGIGRTLLGGGWAVLYLTAFAAYSLPAAKVISDPTVALGVLVAVAVGMILHSLRYRSQLVTALAYGLAFLAIGISPVSLFSLFATAILAASLIAVLRSMPWYHLALVGVAATYLVHVLWLVRGAPAGQAAMTPQGFWLSESAVALYWLLFVIQVLVRKPASEPEARVAYTLNVVNTAGFLGLSAWQVWMTFDTNLYLLAAACMVAYAATAFMLRLARRTGLFDFNALMAAGLAASVLPLSWRAFPGTERWLALCWAGEAAVVLALGFQLKRLPLRVASYALAGAAILALFAVNLSAPLSREPVVAWLTVPPVIVFLYGLFEWLHVEAAKREILAAGHELGAAFGFAATTLLIVFVWQQVQTQYLAPVWLGLAIVFIEFGLRTSRGHVRSQGYYLAIAALAGFLVINLYGFVAPEPGPPRAALVGPGVAALYALHWRLAGRLGGAAAEGFKARFFAFTSYGATGLLAVLLWKELNTPSVALAWGALGLALYEIGGARRDPSLRWQAHAMMAATFGRVFLANFTAVGAVAGISFRMLTIMPIAVMFYYLLYSLGRERASDRLLPFERRLEPVYSWGGFALLAILARFELGRAYSVIAWAPMLVILLGLGVWLRAREFRFQSYLLALLAFARSWTTNVFLIGSYYGVPERYATTVTVVAAFLASAVICLRWRDRFGGEDVKGWRKLLARIDGHAITLFAIVGPTLVAVLLRYEVTGNMLTIAWAIEALLVLGLGFAVNDRSFRYVGLVLMLGSLAKLVVVDLQAVETLFRILSYIALGVILLLASFAYARYRERIGRYL